MIINDIFVGGESDSWNDEINAQSCVNWYPVVGNDKTTKALRRCPGPKEWADVSAGTGADTITDVYFTLVTSNVGGVAERVFWMAKSSVSGNTHMFFTTIDDSGDAQSIVKYGSLTGSVHHKFGDINDNQEMMLIRNSGSSYEVFDTSALTLTTYTPGVPLRNLAYMDGFFFTAEFNSNKVYSTDYQDATTLDTTVFGSAIGRSGDVISIETDRRFLWVFCEKAVEVWYNAGASGFPLLRNPSVFHEIGTRSNYATTSIEGKIFFEGIGGKGRIGIYRTNGFNIEKISPETIDKKLAKTDDMTNTPPSLSSFSYLDTTFVILFLYDANATQKETWLYNDETGLWNEYPGYSAGSYSWLPINRQIDVTVKGRKILVASNYVRPYSAGTGTSIYELDFEYFLDDTESSNVLSCERISAHIYGQDNKAIAHHRLELEFSKDTSLAVALSYSDDDGDNWTSVSTITASDGKYVWRGLGSSKDRLYKITTSTNVEATLINSWLDAEQLNV